MKLRGIQKIFFISHLLFLGFTYSIYLTPYVAPSTFLYLGFVPIGFSLLFFINLIFVFYWMISNWKFGILFLALSIGLYPPISKTYQFFGEKIEADADFKIITYNVNYLSDNDVHDFFDAHKDADVILMQEVYGSTLKKFNNEILSEYYYEQHSHIHFFSRYPIIEIKPIFSRKDYYSGRAAYIDVDTGKDTIRIINVYLESMKITKKLIENIVADSESIEENSGELKRKLAEGFCYHEEQVKDILPYIVYSPHPIILGGDLNAVPNSYEYKQLTYELDDAYYRIGNSQGTTFHDYKYPMRLDYLFHSKDILPISIKIEKVKYSDHYPLIGTFKLP